MRVSCLSDQALRRSLVIAMIRRQLHRNTNLDEKLSIPGVDFLHGVNGGGGYGDGPGEL